MEKSWVGLRLGLQDICAISSCGHLANNSLMIPICTTSLWANGLFGWCNLTRSPGFGRTRCILNDWNLLAQVVNICNLWSFHIRNMEYAMNSHSMSQSCQGTLLDASGHQHGTGTILPAVQRCWLKEWAVYPEQNEHNDLTWMIACFG